MVAPLVDGTAGLAPTTRPDAGRQDRVPGASERPAVRQSRAETVADQLMSIVATLDPGARLGSKEDLRRRCQVSVGTFNEAVRIVQSRGIVSIRPGPGGGVFATAQPPMVRLGNSVLALEASQTSVAEAVRIRDALDPLLIEDALWHASPADVAEMREILAAMAAAGERNDPTAFVQANASLHARIAAVSPHPILRSLYVYLLDQIESHTLEVLPAGGQPLPDYLAERLALHTGIVDALDRRDRERALSLIAEHNASHFPQSAGERRDRAAAAPG